MNPSISLWWRIAATLLLLCCSSLALAEVQRLKFEAEGNYLLVEWLDDDLLHFEYGPGAGPVTDQPLITTDMVCQEGEAVPEVVCGTDFTGPTQFNQEGDTVIETQEVRLVIEPRTLLVTVIDRSRNDKVLTTFHPLNLDQEFKGLVFTRTPELDVYGLGQQFVEPGTSDIDWDGRVREGGEFGNVMAGFNGGANGNTQIPVLYAVNGASYENYALFLDNTYKQRWDFRGDSQWQVEMFGEVIRFYLMTGPDLLDLRRDYMDLVGHPPVPPKRMFGLWISEYGYDHWDELMGKLNSLRSHKFPLDGFVLDLQWFGGIPDVTGECRMGSLDFDRGAFPAPADTMATLRNQHQVGIMLIEEAYVCASLPEHQKLQAEGCLVKHRPGSPEPVFLCGFFGCGSMIDYTDEGCARFWHDDERQKLIESGVIGHWTDLGEPEFFSPEAGYGAGRHADAHNIFNFRWLRGIYRGYQRHQVQQRPFMMSRSGTAGIQRFGAAMWSGDISSRLSSLAAHAANQMHMSFSGIDYYGADIGGFHRNLEGDLNEMYTQWYAYGMMFDIPGRPHVENLCNCKETAPDRIGDLHSNLENTRLRYRLIPYLYSLAHRAYLYGEPVMPPLVMYYQSDPNVRSLGHEKLIGRDLLAAMVAEHGETERDVYLPQGTWFDWHSGRKIASSGMWLPKVPVQRNGVLRLPLYARAGALIPLMPVDEKILNALGERRDGPMDPNLQVRVFPVEEGAETQFTLFEDDGKTLAYQEGAVRTTRISQLRTGAEVLSVMVAAAEGTYAGAPSSRNVTIELVTEKEAEAVQLNGTPLPKRASLTEFQQHETGWMKGSQGRVLAKSGLLPVNQSRQFAFKLKESPPCTSTYRSISVPGEGNGWNPADPQRTLTSCTGKIWQGRITLYQEQYKFAADGAWTVNWGQDGQQDGPNFPARSPGVYEVTFNEADPAHPRFDFLQEAPAQPLHFVCENGHTVPGISVYVVGNVDELGAWEPGKAIKLEPDGPYPTWTGWIPNLPPETPIEWKCIKRQEQGESPQVVQWEPGDNHIVDRGQAEQRGGF
ncbi:glycoside hydrolase family 31 [Nitrosococcus halophilus Nc 4]|uniref:Glycoside hydrolase family 31 n=1 Tax=Nitrosococcus halophilus (strain Nc4) TaxID=472759 RepID=D5BVH2_NITHN|nr:TIM-barrel domain-containing protein [Nitrosococcus halophilus]ADE13600.1 glycoside hydrolase family 31 [Nitrosococcus halophilus Nc 4]